MQARGGRLATLALLLALATASRELKQTVTDVDPDDPPRWKQPRVEREVRSGSCRACTCLWG